MNQLQNQEEGIEMIPGDNQNNQIFSQGLIQQGQNQYDPNSCINICKLIPKEIKFQINSQKLRDPKYLKFKEIDSNNMFVKEYYEGLFYSNQKLSFGSSFKIIENQKGHLSHEYYEGEFALNFYHGFGCLIKFNKQGESSSYSGKFFKGERRDEYFKDIDEKKKKSLQESPPKFYNKNYIEKYYYGPTDDGIRQGLGLYVWPDKYEYLGYFENDRFHGRGRITFADGNTYEGEWKGFYMQGFGEYEWRLKFDYENRTRHESYEKFIGIYFEGKKQHGIYEWSDKVRYFGNFKNDLMDGEALFVSQTGQVKKTKWVEGLKVSEEPVEEKICV